MCKNNEIDDHNNDVNVENDEEDPAVVWIAVQIFKCQANIRAQAATDISLKNLDWEDSDQEDNIPLVKKKNNKLFLCKTL